MSFLFGLAFIIVQRKEVNTSPIAIAMIPRGTVIQRAMRDTVFLLFLGVGKYCYNRVHL